MLSELYVPQEIYEAAGYESADDDRDDSIAAAAF